MSALLSILLHALVLLALDRWPKAEPTPPERVIELAMVAPGDRPEEGEAPGPVEPTPAPAPRTAARATPRPAAPPAPPAPAGERAAPAPTVPAPSEAPPTSFREWRQANRSKWLPTEGVVGGGAPDGVDPATRFLRDRCEPPPRQADVLFLLFDASGSMDANGRADAIVCADQVARAALERGAPVVVGTFARDVVFTGPVRSMDEVRMALRAPVDARATVLPARALGPLLEQAPGTTADLVIVSDGWFLTSPEITVWYEYFLDLHAENRGTVYTVRSPGHRPAIERLRQIGFDVLEYSPVRAAR